MTMATLASNWEPMHISSFLASPPGLKSPEAGYFGSDTSSDPPEPTRSSRKPSGKRSTDYEATSSQSTCSTEESSPTARNDRVTGQSMSGTVQGFVVNGCSGTAQTSSGTFPAGEGEWEAAVMQVVPFLEKEQLKEALSILDRAIVNSQHIKALQKVIDDSMAIGLPDLVSSAVVMSMQVKGHQLHLLRELHQLRHVAMLERARRAAVAQAAEQAVLNLLKVTDYIGRGSHIPWPNPGGLMGMPQAAGLHVDPSTTTAGSDEGTESTEAAIVQGRKELAVRVPKKQMQTLSSSLQQLVHQDPNTLFIVRRINKLGFKASKKLKQFFSSFGVVANVLCAHSTVRKSQWDPKTTYTHRRPSSLGFVQMSTAEAVLQILLNENYEVDGCPIKVQKFERKHGEEAAADALAAEGDGQHQDDQEEFQGACSTQVPLAAESSVHFQPLLRSLPGGAQKSH